MSELGELVEALSAPTLDTRRFVAAGRDLSARQGSLPAMIRALAEAADPSRATLAAALEALVAGYLDQQEQARRYLNQTLMHQATHDPLTGLPNRTALISRLSAAKGQVGVCYIDLDGFKEINDKHGHDAGDTLLRVIAERIGRVATDQGALAARIGGDEFVVLANRPEHVAALARDILDEVREPVAVPGGEVQVTACAGIALGTAASLNASVVADADAALYRAKASGPGQWVIHEPDAGGPMRSPARSMAASISTGLERGEFAMTYLPVVDLADGRLRAARAVPVWRHPALGDLVTGVFLPLAEGTAAAPGLTSWLLETVAADSRDWPDIPVSVALPTAQRVQAATYLEFSETTLSSPQLTELAEGGAKLVITDFGKGTSGLGRLRDLPVAAVVLHHELTCPPDEALLPALSGLAHRIGASVIAADVMDIAQANMLRKAGCDAAFGPLFSEPVSAARLGQLAKTWAQAAALVRLPAQSRRGSRRRTRLSPQSLSLRVPAPRVPPQRRD
jgi:diguanylate cyclase